MSKMMLGINHITRAMTEDELGGFDGVDIYCDYTTPNTCPMLDENIRLAIIKYGKKVVGKTPEAVERIERIKKTLSDKLPLPPRQPRDFI